MNYKLIACGGGGIFSIFMDLIIPNILMLDDIENLYVEVEDNEYNIKPGGFNYVFDQQCDESYKILHCGFKGGWRKKGISLGAIESSLFLADIKRVVRKFKIKSSILHCLYGSHHLGIHFRGKDMNKLHPHYGEFSYEDYAKKAREINPVSIFVAADNYETLLKFDRDFDNVNYYNRFIRGKDEQDDTMKIQLNNADNERFWKEAFIDMLTLSRCDSLLCRTSSFSNAAIAFSDTITKIYRL